MSDTFGSIIRRRILFFIIVGYVAISIVQLFSMQILNGPVYSERSNENSVKPIYQTAPRGILFDRNGNVLVGNKPSFTLRITPSEYKDSLNPYLETILGYEKGYLAKLLKTSESYSKFIPRRIAKDVDFKVIAWYEENSSKLPGVDYVMETQRDYSFGVMGAHMFGYTKEIPASILQKRKNEYMMGDEIGFSGIEKTYEDILRGKKGINYMLVDSRQKTIGSFKEGKENIPTIKGYDLILGIDKDAQKVAEEAFKEKRGAVVAIEPSSGEILAFVSAPEFNLNDFATVTSSKKFSELMQDEDKPMLNRATMGYYSPGSTFKMVSAIAALEEGIIDTTTRIICPGGFQYGNHFFKCLHVHGSTDVYSSIEKSCNTFYYTTVVKLGLDRWSKYSKLLGFGHKTNVDISEEYPGIVPSTEYYNKVYGKNGWTKGFVVSLGIGQGELSVTPIQMAQYAAFIANYGKTAKPHFLKAYIDTKTNKRIDVKPNYMDTGISKRTFDIVRKAMWLVVNGAGTATNIKDPKLNIAGKTGTAQNPHGKDHAIFIGFAPYDNPKIAIAVIVENAGFGSTAAAPIARDVIKAYLQKEKPSEVKDQNIAIAKLGEKN
ncbi:penicillin-binding protein 2 [Stygiobacter electus]|uniref:Penicillin-binding protein 2 n=1 Tax=Stygiobacter electus TaxID=3032292 RepID=A0AAE3TBQ7_9BACT|nr:penicillin-binding protein 2 [Stygiobacter electus]MDF1611100.1 penicillin-binding protein 2 [Stygiobacter electus]